jgi:hypothetical protein
LHSNKFTCSEIPWDNVDVNVRVLAPVVTVKWMSEAQSPQVPDSTLETDAEVRSAIEFMVKRGSKDHFYVTCHLRVGAFDESGDDTHESS